MSTPFAPLPLATASQPVDTSRLATRANLEAAGERFEAIFVNMMLSSMRKAKLSDGLFESNALTQFRDMQDQETARAMAASTPLGIGRAMTEFLSRNQSQLSGAAQPAAPSAAEDGKASA